jgi:hypothetical protein
VAGTGGRWLLARSGWFRGVGMGSNRLGSCWSINSLGSSVLEGGEDVFDVLSRKGIASLLVHLLPLSLWISRFTSCSGKLSKVSFMLFSGAHSPHCLDIESHSCPCISVNWASFHRQLASTLVSWLPVVTGPIHLG